MKANVPEKIYIDANENWNRTYTAFTEKAKGNDIEYVRKDAFIEKAIVWISNNCYIPHSTLENFRKYMEGE